MNKTIITVMAALAMLDAYAAKKPSKGTDVIRVVDLRTERMTAPLSINTPTPRLGWRIESGKKNVMQTSCRIIVASTYEKAMAGEGDLWDTTINGDQSQWVSYAGKQLRSNTPCYWRVKVATTQGESAWSDVQMWNIGLLTESDWSGQWIGFDAAKPWDKEEIHSQLSSRYIRKEFKLDKKVRRATLYISGLGMYEAFINGRKVGDQVLAPAPTDYRKTVLYNAFDVTSMLTTENAIGVALGNGRYYTMQQKKKPYKITNFGYPKLRANLIVEFEDGTRKTISTDSKWKLNADGAIRSNNEYDGEIYDARKEFGAWTSAGFDDSRWENAERVAIPEGTLRGAMAPNMKVLQQMAARSITMHGDTAIIDLGQNIAGWLKLKINGAAEGDSIKICFAETLTKDGRLYRENLRHALSTDCYIANGKENGRWWTPTFVYHGFRYAQITGLKNPKKEDFIGEVVSDEMEKTGFFASSDSILNKVYHNAEWGILANYKGMPVDCPQRDERQPWLGDRTRGCLGESFIFDNNLLYNKWDRDICEAQREDDCIPDVAPAYWNYYSDNITWPAALPFSMEMQYDQFADTSAISKFYPAVRKWISHMEYQYEKDGLMPRDKYGDWCVPPEDIKMIHSKDPKRVTDGTLIATAYYYLLNKKMQRFANILGKKNEAEAFAQKAETVKKAFNRKFLTVKPHTHEAYGGLLYPDSTFYGNNTATANLLPLAFGMTDDPYVKTEVEKNILKNIITDNKGRISCGVIGVQWLMHALSDMGRTDVAWLLATNKAYPSWGYMAENGATTTWELWNGNTASPKMNSGNHVMLLGDLVSWIYQNLGGINSDPAKPGYKHIILKPEFGVDEIDNINASFKSIYGNITSHWRKQNGTLHWDVEIPANATATLFMPDGTTRETGSGKYSFTQKLPTRDTHILADEFLYTKASFPECHSATIAETKNGDLVATYFGGTKERNPDVCIWVSRKPKGSSNWTLPQMVADGVMNDSVRKACWNPVVYQIPGGDLVIYFKIGSKVSDWTGWMVRSKDGGKTWSKRMPLQQDFLGPVKNKPVLSKGRLIAPTSIESDGWRLYFEYSDDMGKTWKRTPYVATDSIMQDGKMRIKDLAIQPTIIFLSDGRLAALARTRSEHVAITYSSDNGETWTKLKLLSLPNNNSGLDAVTLSNGMHVMICNEKPIPHGIKNGKGLRTPLSLMKSDDGENWHHWITLEDSPISQYSYPSIIQTADGHIHCIYTWRRQRIKHIELLP